MSCFETIGYGYSRILSQDIATWFVNKFLSDYDFYVRIVHKGLKRQNSFGFCDCLCEENSTKVFIVDIQSKLPHTLYAKTLLHEFVHVHQFLKGELETRSGKTFLMENVLRSMSIWSNHMRLKHTEQRMNCL